MGLEWIERDQGDFSTFEHGGRLTLEPEDLDFDEWSLWDGTRCVFEGTRSECEEKAEAIMNTAT